MKVDIKVQNVGTVVTMVTMQGISMNRNFPLQL